MAKTIITTRNKQANSYHVYYDKDMDYIFDSILNFSLNIELKFRKNFLTHKSDKTMGLFYAPTFEYKVKYIDI